MLNKYILSSMIIFLLCFMVSCNDSNIQETVGNSISENTTPLDNETILLENSETSTVTTITTTPLENTTTVTSLEPAEYKSIIQNTIDEYEVMLMNLNDIIQNFDGTSSWNDSIEECRTTSQYYLDLMNTLDSTQSVPKKYFKSHERIKYCIEQYTMSIELIQQAINYYLTGENSAGDDVLNEALNRSQMANKVWSEIRGYANVIEYTGETLEPQIIYSQEENQIFSDELETIILQTPEQTTPQTTFQQYNDGYAFGNDNIFIYTN